MTKKVQILILAIVMIAAVITGCQQNQNNIDINASQSSLQTAESQP